MRAFLRPRVPDVKSLLFGSVEMSIARHVGLIDPGFGSTCNEIAKRGLVEIDQLAAIAHPVVTAQFEVEEEGATGRESSGVLDDDAEDLRHGHVESRGYS